MTRKNAEAKTEKDTSSRIPLFAAIITGVFVVGAATVTAGWWSKLIFGSPKTFVVTVRNTASEKPLRGAKIRLESEGVPPIEKFSDSNGSAQFRIDDPKKRWKFNPGDLEERKIWDQYQEAYEDALTKCNTAHAPWHIIPSDRNWYRNLAVSELLLDTLQRMDPKYPPPPEDLPKTVE